MNTELSVHELHLILDGSARTGKLYAAGGNLLFEFEARNRTVNNGQFGHWGNCPPGKFLAFDPIHKGTVPFGMYFIPLGDYDDQHAMADHHRSGIGIHGGGSGLKQPFAPRQGWVVTHGCFRIQNEDLEHLVHLLKAARGVGGRCYVTVLPWTPGAERSDGEPDILVKEEDLDPGE